MLYSSGTTGRPKGVKPPLPGGAARHDRRRSPASCRCCSASTPTVGLPLPAPLYHAAPLRFSMASQRLGGTVVVMEHFDPEEALALIERYQVTPRQCRADDVRPHAQAAARGASDATTCRACKVVHPRRRAVPGRGEAADDRVVGSDHPRVLRGHRGQRLRLHATPRTGSRTRAPSASALVGRSCTSSTTTATSCRPASRARSTSRAAPTFEYHNDPEKTAVVAQRARAGRRSATSATSTTRATCTSPTARRT